ncbi:hypothetical protein BTVI_148121 [Pitangus sulphuratus]|nr:hypothetical protein BTVI_148121 [Pitangus sulphuratus]
MSEDDLKIKAASIGGALKRTPVPTTCLMQSVPEILTMLKSEIEVLRTPEVPAPQWPSLLLAATCHHSWLGLVVGFGILTSEDKDISGVVMSYFAEFYENYKDMAAYVVVNGNYFVSLIPVWQKMKTVDKEIVVPTSATPTVIPLIYLWHYLHTTDEPICLQASNDSNLAAAAPHPHPSLTKGNPTTWPPPASSQGKVQQFDCKGKQSFDCDMSRARSERHVDTEMLKSSIWATQGASHDQDEPYCSFDSIHLLRSTVTVTTIGIEGRQTR